jgi:hypothetical protein
MLTMKSVAVMQQGFFSGISHFQLIVVDRLAP